MPRRCRIATGRSSVRNLAAVRRERLAASLRVTKVDHRSRHCDLELRTLSSQRPVRGVWGDRMSYRFAVAVRKGNWPQESTKGTEANLSLARIRALVLR